MAPARGDHVADAALQRESHLRRTAAADAPARGRDVANDLLAGLGERVDGAPDFIRKFGCR